MTIVLILAPSLIISVMSSSESIIEGALISVGGKNKNIFANFFCYCSYNQVIWCLLKMFSPFSTWAVTTTAYIGYTKVRVATA